ncbi:sigma-E factor negative regulatory protein RseA [Izhakiella capsodis]|uniref:Anti-sigma-E factor RseA n=1 Tax=Izhakiella capsodis TaxID=1367852 RepID=A0A1I4WCL9_9GAMM|nr:anti-sigma-E factor RseA [Izhakiella capsodis]SFN11175.1 sigma-E factor negative regulatory protein RseA [Izhakiella capsodis]
MQKEKLSAFMDGEALDNEAIAALSGDVTLQRSWRSYHLIRDTLRGDVAEVIHFDISARVAAAIEQEPKRNVTSLIPESQPEPTSWARMPFWYKVRPWAAQITQVGVAACVSLAVIVGVQHYNQPAKDNHSPSDSPVFNTLPMMGQASPVSYGVPQNIGVNGQLQSQHRLANALLQDYELQRRLHAEQLQIEPDTAHQAAAVQVPGTQSLGNQQQ